MFDQDENGALDAAEYDLFDETRTADMQANAGGHNGQMRGVSQAMARDFNDVDKDGLVTEEEFLSRVYGSFYLTLGRLWNISASGLPMAPSIYSWLSAEWWQTVRRMEI